ncbi:uncharacterized protein A4U43_C05F31000 [Asparagus officinalis]|uniref:VQ domain-containing protein n=1 Tax=Asparagus officinalis TaxID=4686 RepID=A0A5P1F0B5_ASPOF|nr:VQ motif-containing protein 25-like [Asparagus officinalis]ONK70171.1 uncharacterized protein A4U43_C05F31000 [Asparagus officinalis]
MKSNTNAKAYEMSPPKPTALSMSEDSRSISKPNPKIRIVHIIEPEIIKTDAASFKELVQRLTGIPTKGGALKNKARQMIKKEWEEEEEEEERAEWRLDESLGGSDNNNYMGGLGDVDGFFQGFDDFPSMLYLSSSSRTDHVIGGAQVM